MIAAAGHDVQWVGDGVGDPGDAAILSTAHAESRVLVTLDKDFGELAIVKGAQPENEEGRRQFDAVPGLHNVVGMAEWLSNVVAGPEGVDVERLLALEACLRA